jgi:23S rRNA m2A2503 methyltransferase
MIDIKSYTIAMLEEYLLSIGEAKYRANQIFEWIHKKHVQSFDEMSNISSKLKLKLKEDCILVNVEELLYKESAIDKTRKYLFKLPDGNIIESVFMRYKHGNSVCISSQVGCRMGCRFCASTLDGLLRDLSASEMLDQIYKISSSTGERVSNIVLMGAGEPMDNFDNVIKFIEIINSDQGLNISQRNITVSTCGLVPRIKELADKKLQITLALSLHAADDETRKSLMPIANKYSIKEVLDACRYYFDTTKRRVSYEYGLVAGVNDTKEEALKLAKLIKNMHAHINLIPINPIEERDYKEPSHKNVLAFKEILEKSGIQVTIRREMGRDIDGACGQLRRSFMA